MAPQALTTTATTSSLEQAQHHDKSQPTGLSAISQGVPLPPPPIFSTYEKQRHHMLGHMAGAFRVFARKGYTEGISGHISLRDPEWKDYFWTNPLGRHFALLTVHDMILLNHAGAPIGGNTTRPANSAGFLIHSAVHAARPDVTAACHTHSPHGKAWSAFGRRLDMLNQDVCNFYGDAQGVYDDFGGVVFSEEEGRRLAAALGEEGKGLVLQNHGLLTVGSTVDEAAYLFTLMERSCEVQLLVEAAERTGRCERRVVGDEAAEFTFQASDPESLYWEFQPDLEYEIEVAGGSFLD